MSLEKSSKAEVRRLKINASSNAFSLWLCLLAFQAVRCCWLVFLLRSDGLVSYIVLGIGGTLYLEMLALGWIVAKHGFAPTGDSPFAIVSMFARQATGNPIRRNMHTAISPFCFLLVVIPALWFVEFLQPGRLLNAPKTL